MMRKFRTAVGIAAAAFWSASALGASPATGWTPSVIEEEAPPATRINPTGRAIEIEATLKLDGARLGEVPIKISADEKIFVDAMLLKTYLGKIVKTDVLTAALQTSEDPAASVAEAETTKRPPGAAASSVVQKAAIEKAPEPQPLGQEKPVYVALDLLVARGLAMRYDPNALELQVEPSIEQRRPGDISFARHEEIDSASLQAPAYVSAYVNMRMAASYVSQSSSGSTGVESPSFDFDAAARIGRFVLEGEGTFNSGDAKGFSRNLFNEYAFYRRGTRLVYDMPEDAIRVRAGDVTPDFAGLQTSPDILGLAAGTNYTQLQPGKSIRPTGAQSFRIERPSTVDVIVGNALVRRLKLGPGIYNLSDLPLQGGANDIKLVITDDAGASRTLQFTAFSGYELLAPGMSEWSVSAGVKSLDNGIANYADATAPGGYTVVNKSSKRSFYGQRDYYFDQPAATGYYRRGITDAVTAQADIQADNIVTMAGGGLVTQNWFGMVAGELAASESYEGGLGFGVKLAYGYDKFNWFDRYKASFRLAADWRSANFTTVQTYSKNGIVSPQPYNGSLSASYTQTLPYDVSAGLSFSYYLLLDAQGIDNRPGDRWDVDFSLSRQLWDHVSGSLSVGYGQDSTITNQTCCMYNREGFRTFVQISWTPDAHSNALATLDSRAESARVSYSQSSEKTGVGSWAATVDATAGAQDQGAINASASYVANRANVSVSHSAGLVGLGYNGAFNPSFTEERTSLAVASSFVYADGAWGVGRPVTGSFALVTPHKSLEGSPIVVGTADSVVAESDFLGAAVVPSVSAYSRTRLAYDAPGAPAGYDLGSASYDLKAPHKGGYNLEAGSAYTITAVGTLSGADGQPLPLLAGTAREANKENGRKVELFTNRVGRFGAQGLAPGRWLIEMPTEPELTRYVIEIPEGVVGLHNAGELKPDGRVGEPQSAPHIEAGMSHEAS
jgi:outer membrane usher protein